MIPLLRWLPLATLLTSFSCQLGTEPYELVPAALILEEEGPGSGALPPVLLPAEVMRGETFTVTIHSLEGGCVRRADRAAVSVVGRNVEISPFNRQRRGRNLICPSDLLVITHTVSVRIHETGQATVRIHGRRDTYGPGGRTSVPVTLERQILVR
jgi:hypothetical protein